MSKVVILGNSLAAISAVKEIRTNAPDAEITLFCPEGVLPYDRTLLPSLIVKDIKESHIHPEHDKFFKEHNVHVVLNEALVRVSTKRKNITTGNKTHIPFDKLLMTDLGVVKLPTVKGYHKKGVFDGVRLTAIKEISKYLPYADNIAIHVTNMLGFDLACALMRLGKQVIVVTKGEGLLDEMFDEETSVLLKQITESKGIRVMSSNAIEEILGDSEVKAVRLKSGKVMAAEAVIFDQVETDLKALGEEDLPSDVLTCDVLLMGFALSKEESLEHGKCAVANLLKAQSRVYEPPFVLREFGHKVCDGFYGGHVRLQEGGREVMRFDGPSNVYKKIYLLNDRLEGAVWLNAMNEQEKVKQALIEKIVLTSSEDQFLQSTNQG